MQSFNLHIMENRIRLELRVKLALKFILLLIFLGTAPGCKKPYSDDDVTLYKWKREMYRAHVNEDGPAVFFKRDPRIIRNNDAIFVNSDMVILTERGKDQQQDSIFIASGRTLVYKYEKVERVEK